MSRRLSARSLWPPVLAALLASACTGASRPPHPGMNAFWREYSAMPPYRALAVAGDPDSHWVGAASSSAATQIEAEQGALAECRRKRAQRRMQAPCRLYAVGGEVVWDRR